MLLRRKRQSAQAGVTRVGSAYRSPRVLGESEVLLERNLLGDSVSLTSRIETAGQVNDGFYEESDIVSGTDNAWFD
jgi:hypothetical protein